MGDGSKSKKRIQRHPSHTLDLDDLEEEDEYNDNLKHSEDDSAEFDLDSVEIKKKSSDSTILMQQRRMTMTQERVIRIKRSLDSMILKQRMTTYSIDRTCRRLMVTPSL